MIVTLLPFTPKQRDHFIQSWFAANNTGAIQILKHISKHRELDEIIRNPLLATILCVLKENGVPLPDNELRLYEERMRLLLGDYDVQKGVRRLKSQRYFLRLASQKLAFRLHCSVKRNATRGELYEWISRVLKGQLSPTALRTLVDELLDPCNILCPMTEDGKLGFGHLRFQEYLAAVELIQNRGIDIVSLVRQPWWRGVLVLFSMMNESIEWFIETFLRELNISAARDTIMAMIDARPFEERSRLHALVQVHAAMDLEMRELRGLADYRELLDDDEIY